MNVTTAWKVLFRRPIFTVFLSAIGLAGGASAGLAAEALPNACPVDGCKVMITEIKPSGDELELTFEANFTPDLSKNHIHIWWGEHFTVEQVSRNAETEHGVKQGKWHLTDDYPGYKTQGAVSTKVRGDATTICVSVSDRDHNILDTNAYHCTDVGQYF